MNENIQADDGTPRSFFERAASASMYLLLPALLPAAWVAARVPQAAAHRRHALASAFLLAALAILFGISVIIISYVMVFHREQFQDWKVESTILDTLWKALLAWGVLHLFAVVHATLWPGRPIPVLTRIGNYQFARAIGTLFIGLIAGAGLLAGALTLDAMRLTNPGDAEPRVLFVYEDNDQFPEWLFRLGFYRIARETRAQYDYTAAQVLPLTPDNIRRALRQGEFVVIGSHGLPQGLIADGRFFKPRDIDRAQVNKNLKYVYLTGCDSERLAKGWRHKLRPAKVVTHDRLTAVIEHIWWLWIEGPSVLREVKKDEEVQGA